MKKFCESLRESTIGTTNFKKKKMKFLTNSKNHMKMQNLFIFAEKHLKINMLRIKHIAKVTNCCPYTGEYGVTTHCIYNLKYSLPIVFHKRSNYDNNHFIIKELIEEFEKQFTCLEKNTETFIELTRKDERREKNRRLYPTDYNFLTAQDLWQPHNQVLSIILLKEFIKLNLNRVTI